MNDEKTKYIVIGGLISGLISVLPFIAFINCFCCIGIISGGYIGVWLYHRGGYPIMTLADGALMGLIIGIFAALVNMIVELFFVQLFGTSPNTALMLDFFKDFAEQVNDPNFSTQLQDLENMQIDNSITFSNIISNLIFSAIIYGLFAMIGGLIRTSQDQNKNKNQNNLNVPTV